MKKKMDVLKKIDQFLVEEYAPIELEELYVILIKSTSKHKQEDNKGKENVVKSDRS